MDHYVAFRMLNDIVLGNKYESGFVLYLCDVKLKFDVGSRWFFINDWSRKFSVFEAGFDDQIGFRLVISKIFLI